MSDVEKECNSIIDELNQLNILKNLSDLDIDEPEHLIQNDHQLAEFLDIIQFDIENNFNQNYDHNDKLIIEIGTSKLPRISCSSHKVNNNK